jgi:hypothetical protein
MAKCEDAFDSKPEKKYRYFNQPIEQIPGWSESEYQVLVHSEGCGLQWHTVQCLDVMICFKKEDKNIVAERKNIVVFKEQEEKESSGCPPVECCDESGGVAILETGLKQQNYVYDHKTGRWVMFEYSDEGSTNEQES